MEQVNVWCHIGLLLQFRNVIIWGNHSATQYPDVSHALVDNHPQVGYTSNVKSAINNDTWVMNDFIPTIQQVHGISKQAWRGDHQGKKVIQCSVSC